MAEQTTREYYINLLRAKAEETGRYPQKSDFSAAEVSRIKSFWGPWRHALEAAGLMEDKSAERAEKNRLKRQRAKEKRAEKKE